MKRFLRWLRQTLIVCLLLMVFFSEQPRRRFVANALELNVGGEFYNTGRVGVHVQSSPKPPLLAGAAPTAAATPAIAHDLRINSRGRIHNTGTLATDSGRLYLRSSQPIRQDGAAVAHQQVTIDTPATVHLGPGSVTAVLASPEIAAENTTLREPAVHITAAAIEGKGGVVGDLNSPSARRSVLNAANGSLVLGPHIVTHQDTKRSNLGLKKRTTVIVRPIPFQLHGPMLLLTPRDLQLIAVQFYAPPDSESILKAQGDILLQAATGSVYEARSQCFGRASSYAEQAVPTSATNALSLETPTGHITLRGVVPANRLVLIAPQGHVAMHAVPLYTRIRKTGLGAGIDVSALAGMAHVSMDVPYIQHGYSRPTIKAGFSAPLQSFQTQWQDPHQPDWAKALNMYGAAKDVKNLWAIMQQPEKLAALHVEGRVSYTSYLATQTYYVCNQWRLASLLIRAQHLTNEAIRVEALDAHIEADTIMLRAALSTTNYRVDTRAVSIGFSIGASAPIQIGVSGSSVRGAQEHWVPAELLAHHLHLKARHLTVAHGRVQGMTGQLHVENMTLSEHQDRLIRRIFSAAASTSGALHIALRNDMALQTVYHTMVQLLETGYLREAVHLPNQERHSALTLDARFVTDMLQTLKDNPVVTRPTHATPLSRGLTAESSSDSRSPDPTVKPRDDGMNKQLQQVEVKKQPGAIKRPISKPMTHHVIIKPPMPHGPRSIMTLQSNQPNSYPKAVVNGVITGLKQLWELLKHPLDNFFIPTSALLCDTAICLFVTEEAEAGRLIPYRLAAIGRMQERRNELIDDTRSFLEATSVEQVEKVSTFLTTLIVPRKVWKRVPIVPTELSFVTTAKLHGLSQGTVIMYVVLKDSTLHLIQSNLLSPPDLAQAPLADTYTMNKVVRSRIPFGVTELLQAGNEHPSPLSTQSFFKKSHQERSKQHGSGCEPLHKFKSTPMHNVLESKDQQLTNELLQSLHLQR